MDWSRLVNLTDYTPLELILFGGGCYMWVVVYAIYVRNIFKFKFIEMPLFAACGNIGWEFTWGFLAETDMGPLLVWCYQIWFIFDLFIFYHVLKYGWKQVTTQGLHKHLKVTSVLAAIAWGAAIYAMVISGLDTPIGANSAFILNLCIAALYIVLLLQQTTREQFERFSWAVAWLKMVGTGMNTVFMNMHYTDNYFVRFVAIVTTVLDCTYIYMFWRKRQQFRDGA